MSTVTDQRTLDKLCIDTIRTLSMDAVQKANSGHPGTPMALAPLAYVLYTRLMRHNPADAEWPDRDRFVLSCGHASMLLYSSLYLAGYGLELEDLERFRQLGSPTAGHPEHGDAAGIEVDDRPARAGDLQRGRLRARRAHAGGALQPPRARDRRSPHVGVLLRRRPRGRDLPRVLLARRPPRAGPARSSSTTTTTSRSRATPRSPSATTSAGATRPTAGTCRTCARTSSWTGSSRRRTPRRPRPSAPR